MLSIPPSPSLVQLVTVTNRNLILPKNKSQTTHMKVSFSDDEFVGITLTTFIPSFLTCLVWSNMSSFNYLALLDQQPNSADCADVKQENLCSPLLMSHEMLDKKICQMTSCKFASLLSTHLSSLLASSTWKTLFSRWTGRSRVASLSNGASLSSGSLEWEVMTGSSNNDIIKSLFY